MRVRQLVGAVIVLGVSALTILACVAHQLIPCGDDLCPTSSVCTVGGCASPEAAVACEDMTDGAPCSTPTFSGGTCAGGACYPSVCGNGVVDDGELCDDGNTLDADGCSRDCLSIEACGNKLVDLAVGEQCDTGVAGLSSDGCSSQCKVEFDLWRDITLPAPSNRIHAPFVPNSNGRLMLIGGSLGSSAGSPGALADVLEWDGLTWRVARTMTPLPAVTRAAATYDSVRRRVVVFGGYLATGLESDRTWEYDGVTWTDRSPAVGPRARSSARLSYDPNGTAQPGRDSSRRCAPLLARGMSSPTIHAVSAWCSQAVSARRGRWPIPGSGMARRGRSERPRSRCRSGRPRRRSMPTATSSPWPPSGPGVSGSSRTCAPTSARAPIWMETDSPAARIRTAGGAAHHRACSVRVIQQRRAAAMARAMG